MTEQTKNLAILFAACWKDADLKIRFQANPKEVLAEYGMEVPEDIDVNVVENSDNTVHITLPMAPDNHSELSEDELVDATGGTNNGVWAPGLLPNILPPVPLDNRSSQL